MRLLADDDQDDRDKGSEKGGSQGDIGDKLNEMLNKPFFDPEQQGREDDPSFLKGFRRKFDEDPEFASTLFVGFYFALLLFFAQQGVRIYKHCYFMPDKLCPWDAGVTGGSIATENAFEALQSM